MQNSHRTTSSRTAVATARLRFIASNATPDMAATAAWVKIRSHRKLPPEVWRLWAIWCPVEQLLRSVGFTVVRDDKVVR